MFAAALWMLSTALSPVSAQTGTDTVAQAIRSLASEVQGLKRAQIRSCEAQYLQPGGQNRYRSPSPVAWGLARRCWQ